MDTPCAGNPVQPRLGMGGFSSMQEGLGALGSSRRWASVSKLFSGEEFLPLGLLRKLRNSAMCPSAAATAGTGPDDRQRALR
jgi:hypothetical protein